MKTRNKFIYIILKIYTGVNIHNLMINILIVLQRQVIVLDVVK